MNLRSGWWGLLDAGLLAAAAAIGWQFGCFVWKVLIVGASGIRGEKKG